MTKKEEMMNELALNGAMYIKGVTQNQAEQGNCLSAFDLSFAMEVLTQTPKEECLTLLLKMQTKIAQVEGIINKI
jgi:hypothetical protein